MERGITDVFGVMTAV